MMLISSCNAQSLNGKVVKVSDGDTFTLLLENNSTVRIRLHGVDAPEMKGGQPYSRVSREYLSGMIAGKQVTVAVKDTDRYGRYIGVVSTTTIKDVNLKMIESGMAWHYSYYDNTPAYIKAQKRARQDKKGLWKDKNPINPYQWRKK